MADTSARKPIPTSGNQAHLWRDPGQSPEPVAEEVKYDAEGYPVPPRSFVDGIFKGGAQGDQLYARIWKGMKGTPMPASEGIYDGDEMWDLIHYVQSLMRQGAQERAQAEFRDAVAIQFSLTSDPPFYMGSPEKHGGVNIWMWKADRQTDLAKGFQDVDAAFPGRVVDRYPEQDYRLKDMSVTEWPRATIAKHDPLFITAWGAGNLVANPQRNTPVECLVARGPGTLSGKPPAAQLVEGQAVYERGLWYVQLQRSMALPHDAAHGQGAVIDERRFRSGDYLPVSFAIWNGSAGDRDGKKNISIWQKLVIE